MVSIPKNGGVRPLHFHEEDSEQKTTTKCSSSLEFEFQEFSFRGKFGTKTATLFW